MASKLVPSRSGPVGHALRPSLGSNLPGFLLPAWQRQTPPPRQFSTTTQRSSKLGRTPIAIPPGVELSISELKTIRVKTSYKPVLKKTISLKGPLGQLLLDVPEYMSLEKNTENNTLLLHVESPEDREQKMMWGTSWSYLNNCVTGVSEGHNAIVRLVGVGYRATVEARPLKEKYPGQMFLCLKLGFSHPIEEGIPKGVKVSAPSPTRILMEGMDRVELMSFAGKVRLHRPPEPYKGKGVFINDETIKLKTKKIK